MPLDTSIPIPLLILRPQYGTVSAQAGALFPLLAGNWIGKSFFEWNRTRLRLTSPVKISAILKCRRRNPNPSVCVGGGEVLDYAWGGSDVQH